MKEKSKFDHEVMIKHFFKIRLKNQTFVEIFYI